MDFDTNRIKIYVTSAILTFMGILAIQMSFMYTFFENSIYSIPLMMCYVLIISMLFCAGAVFVRRKWILPVVVIVLCAWVVWLNFYEIAGGLGEIFNTVAAAVSEYFDAEVLFMDMTPKMDKFGDPEIFSFVAVTLLTLIYSYTISTRKLMAIPLLCSVVSVMMPIFVEIFPTFFAVLYTIVYCMEMMMLMTSVNMKNKDFHNKFQTELAAIIMGVFLMICGGIINLIIPAKDFKQDTFFKDFRVNVENELEELRESFGEKIGNKTPSRIGAGKLGHINKLSFSGEEVLTVKLPKIEDTIYLKGYIGATYDNDKWIEPTAKNSDALFGRIKEEGYNQIEMVGLYLESLDMGTDYTGYKGKMAVNRKNLFDIDARYFSPLYITGIRGDADKCADYMEDDKYYIYYSVSGWEFLTDKMDDSGMPEYWAVEKQYRDYVEMTYLDVNTTIADELKAEWGNYPTDSAAERLALAQDIRDYLADNCTYTTSPGKLPKGKDFVEYFLKETNKGYCTYFATAAVMMFRSAGVPARYVEGYSFNVTGKESTVEYGLVETSKDVWVEHEYCEVSVKDSNAHAWVEFYVNGVGWIDFEVTPGNDDGLGEIPEPEEPTTEEPSVEEPTTKEPSTEEPTTKEQASETESTEIETSVSEGGNDKDFTLPKLSKKAECIILVVCISIIVIISLVMFIRINYLKCQKYRKVIYEDDLRNLTGESILMNFKRFESLMKYSGFVKQEHMTYMDFANLVEDRSETVGKGEAVQLAKIIEKLHYSKEKISKEEIEKCNGIVINVYDRIYGNVGLVKKFILKYILNY